MNNKFPFKNAFIHFIKLFKNQNKLLIFTTVFIITSVLLSISIPIKTANIIDNVLNNIKINNHNQITNKIIESYKPFIKEIENINFEAITMLNKNLTINDLIKVEIITKKGIKLLNNTEKEIILNTDIMKFKNINCYECKTNKDYLKTINEIYQIINIDKNIILKETIKEEIYIDIILVISFIIIIFLINYFSNITMCKINKNITNNLKNSINKKIHNVRLNYYSQNSEGDILSLITNDIENISGTIATEFVNIINSITLFISLIIIMFYLSIKLTLVLLTIIPIIFILLLITLIKSNKYFKVTQDTLGVYNDFILNSYNGYKIIKSYNQKENFYIKEDTINKKLYKNTWKSNFFGGLMQPIIQFSGNLNFLAICIFGSILVIKGNISLGILQAFITYTKSFNNPLISIASTISTIEQTLVSNERIYNFLNSPEISEPKKLENAALTGDITFENVSFGYEKTSVLKNINFKIKQGEKVAIVGETGSGKTTIIKLLLKLYSNYDGTIKINNTDISKIDTIHLRNNIGVVMQEAWLFNGTLTDNINYGSPTNTEKVKNVCRKMQFDKIIKKLPKTYNYEIKDNTSLSKGEKQLIAIARTFIKNKSILILDEATSNIDIETEKIIQKAANELMNKKTCLIIAHRLSTITNSDKIIVLHNGEIKEIGTHQELLKNKSYYYDLYKNQYK